MAQACWRDLRAYKYQLVDDYQVPVTVHPAADIVTDYVGLTAAGQLSLRKGYAWDGPSGPTIDTPTFMRGSLVHDALYQLMRLGKLDHREHRKAADQMLKTICLEDGMVAFRAAYTYLAVRWLAASHAKPAPQSGDQITCMPRIA